MLGTSPVSSEDSTLDRRRLAYVLSEALERLFRLRAILTRQEVFIAAEGVGGEPANALQKLRDRLQKHSKTFLANSGLLAVALRGTSLNEAQWDAVRAALDIFIREMGRIHELLVLLPREAARPQASFLLHDCFGLSELSASIVLTNSLSAYEYRFEDVLEVSIGQEERETLTQQGNVLCQAFGDRDNPLAWAVLAHEYGHAIDDNKGISSGILKDQVNGKADRFQGLGPDLERRIVGETVADFVAAHVLGPASLMPIIFLSMLQPKLSPLTRKSAGHPPSPLRVELVRDYLKKELRVETTAFEPVFQSYVFDYRQKLEDMGSGERANTEEVGKHAEKLLKPLAGAVAQKVESLGLASFQETNATAARALRETLERRQPISGKRSRSDEQTYKELSALKAGVTERNAAYQVLAQLDEQPVAASEIVTAGWLYRLSSLEEKLLATFPESGAEPDLNSYFDYVGKTDDWLSKSLELTAVQSEVLKRLSAASKHAAI